MVEVFAWVTLGFAIGSALLFLCNYLAFRKAPSANRYAGEVPAVSVLIPARDEARGILQTLHAILANRSVDVEVVVLDDHSQDATATLVTDLAALDSRVRLIRGSTLPRGWCGKQYACHQLAQQARHDEFLFIDADVTLAADAILRCLLQRRATGADLLSGFPRQIVGSLGEAMLIPLMYVVLLTYLPFVLMRRTNMTSAAAGCGQLFLTSRSAYQQAGGHAAIRSSLHDGLTLPRAYRRAGLTTDVFDASDFAQCRMYRGLAQTWSGLIKNAHEGIANWRLLLPLTSLMIMGYVAPTALLLSQGFQARSLVVLAVAAVATIVSYLPRVLTAARFDRAWFSTALFPISILLFVALQWVAFGRRLVGTHSHWRGRTYTAETA